MYSRSWWDHYKNKVKHPMLQFLFSTSTFLKFTWYFIAYPEILVVCLLEFLIQLNFCTNFNNYFIKLMILLRKILKKFIYFRVIIKGMSRGDEHCLRICDFCFLTNQIFPHFWLSTDLAQLVNGNLFYIFLFKFT